MRARPGVTHQRLEGVFQVVPGYLGRTRLRRHLPGPALAWMLTELLGRPGDVLLLCSTRK